MIEITKKRQQEPTRTTKRLTTIHTPEERLAIWEHARGIWKNRKPDPIKELEKMRKEWDRDLPHLK